IQTVFQAIHDGRPDQSLLAYQYLQMMPKIAEGDANKRWIVPSRIGKALEGLGSTMSELTGIPKDAAPAKRVDMGPAQPQLPQAAGAAGSSSASKAVQEAIEAAAQASATRPAPGAGGDASSAGHQMEPPAR